MPSGNGITSDAGYGTSHGGSAYGGAAGAGYGTDDYDYSAGGPMDPKKAAQEQYVGGMKQAALNSGQVRPLYGHELYGGPSQAAQYAQGATQLAQAQMRQGLGQAQRGMAAQALSRGSNPLAMRGAIDAGGQASMQAANLGAQLQAQGMMGASQLAHSEQQMRINALNQIKQQQLNKYATDKQAAHAKEMLNHEKDQAGFGAMLQGLGTAAAVGGTILGAGSDIRAKQDIQPMTTTIGTPLTGNEPSLGVRNYYMGSQGGPLEGLPMADQAGAGYAGQAAMAGQTPGAGGAMGQGFGWQQPQQEQGAGGMLGGALSALGGGLMSDERAKEDAYAMGHRVGAEQAYERMHAAPQFEREMLYQDAMAERQGRLAPEANRLGAELQAAPHPRGFDPPPGLMGGRSPTEAELRAMDARSPRTLDELRAMDIRMQRTPLDDSLRALKPYAYRYRPEAAQAWGQPTDMRAGIMAQDAEQDPLTAAMVRDTPQGKAIDMPTAVGTSLAGVGRLAERVDALEQQQSPGAELMQMPAASIQGDPEAHARREARRQALERGRQADPWATNDIGNTDPEMARARALLRPLSDREQLEWAYRQGRGGM